MRQTDLVLALQYFFIDHGMEKKYCIAYSGGLDSHVLLHLCKTLRTNFHLKLQALHINHGLSPRAHDWAKHCARVCEEYDIEYHERAIHIETKAGLSLEEEAREKRKAIFAEYIEKNDVLLTAHQQDDQAETVLLQLIRGSGPKGLAAMSSYKPFAQGFHGRPLLPFSRFRLQQYAEEHHLHWIEDESNKNIKLTRNFLRHDIFTLLKTRWPHITNTLSRTATHCAEAQDLLEEYAVELCKQVKGSRENTLSVSKLKQLHHAKQRLVLRTWMTQSGYILPNQKKLETIQDNLLHAAWDKRPSVSWKNSAVKRYRDDLYLLKHLSQPDPKIVYEWDFNQPLILPGIGKLHVISTKGEGLSLDVKQISIRFRQGGEYASFCDRQRRTLKNLFQEWQVLPWERHRIPFIFFEEKLIGVLGYFFDAHYVAKENECGRKIVLDRG